MPGSRGEAPVDDAHDGIRLHPVRDDLLAGAPDAATAVFVELYRSLVPGLRTYLAGRCPPDDVEDVLADTFVVVWRRLEVLPVDEDRRRGWVYGIAKNCLRDTDRKRRRSARGLMRVSATTVPADPPSAEDRLVSDDALEALLGRLPPGERDAVRITVLDGVPPTEAAAMLGTSVSAVTSAVHRARLRLRRMLSGSAEEVEE